MKNCLKQPVITLLVQGVASSLPRKNPELWGLFWEWATGVLIRQQIPEPQGRELQQGTGSGGHGHHLGIIQLLKINVDLMNQKPVMSEGDSSNAQLLRSRYKCDKAGDISAGWKEELSYPGSYWTTRGLGSFDFCSFETHVRLCYIFGLLFFLDLLIFFAKMSLITNIVQWNKKESNCVHVVH